MSKHSKDNEQSKSDKQHGHHKAPRPAPDRLLELEFDDNSLLPSLYGPHNSFLQKIERHLGVMISAHGNIVTIAGHQNTTQMAHEAIDALWERLLQNLPVTEADVDAAIRIATSQANADTKQMALAAFRDKPNKNAATKRKHITPRSTTQAEYLKAIEEHDLTFGVGPAGTGKTYLAVAHGVSQLIDGKVDRLVFTRPAVEAGEHLGFLPGDMQEKIDPFLRPVYDALYDMLPQDQVVRMMALGQIEIAPLAFMRGRTLADAYIVLDEAQNTTPMQMKMFLTRLGDRGKMVINGDITQTDLPRGMTSGLQEALRILHKVPDIGVVEFSAADVVRHPLVAKIIVAYDKDKS